MKSSLFRKAVSDIECPFRVEVKHGDNVVGFEFNRMSDAVAFINSAIDTIDNYKLDLGVEDLEV